MLQFEVFFVSSRNNTPHQFLKLAARIILHVIMRDLFKFCQISISHLLNGKINIMLKSNFIMDTTLGSH